MIKILNQNRQPVAILENAYDISYEKGFNQLWLSSFSLPLDDEKNDLCKPLYFVEVYDNGEYVGLFRIIPALTAKDESGKTVTYQCEHVLATLLDDVMFNYHQTDGLPTAENIDYILEQQSTRHWQRGQVDFVRHFSYKWENENGLLAPMFSIPKPFDVPFQWTHETQSYPWTLNLVEPEMEVSCEARYGLNVKGIEREVDPTTIYNRIYPLGYGEGDNQLNIKSINNGIPYVEDTESIALYGVKAMIWVDKRFEDVQSLKASGEALLEKLKIPKITYRGSAADISSITGESIHKLKMGKIIRWIDDDLGIIEARIMKESKSDATGSPGDVQLEIGNKVEDLGTTQADLQRRQQINELYSQGATNIDSTSIAENADSTHPVILDIWLPDEVVKVNRFDLTYRIEKFRAYEQAIEGGGAQVGTTGGGGGTTKSSSSGGGTSTSTASDGNHSHMMFQSLAGPVQGLPNALFYGKNSAGQTIPVEMPANNVDLYTFGSSGSHTHTFSVLNHSHTITLDNHSHSIELPDHVHGIKYGIYEAPDDPTEVTIKVNGVNVPQTNPSGENIDLVPYLPKDSEGRIQRGTWLKVEITPNALGRIVAQVVKQVFIQSRGNYTL